MKNSTDVVLLEVCPLLVTLSHRVWLWTILFKLETFAMVITSFWCFFDS